LPRSWKSAARTTSSSLGVGVSAIIHLQKVAMQDFSTFASLRGGG
jgi:hypothetical protein